TTPNAVLPKAPQRRDSNSHDAARCRGNRFGRRHQGRTTEGRRSQAVLRTIGVRESWLTFPQEKRALWKRDSNPGKSLPGLWRKPPVELYRANRKRIESSTSS